MLGWAGADAPGDAAAFGTTVELKPADAAAADPSDKEMLRRSTGLLLRWKGGLHPFQKPGSRIGAQASVATTSPR
jgi:hypothetical protein